MTSVRPFERSVTAVLVLAVNLPDRDVPRLGHRRQNDKVLQPHLMHESVDLPSLAREARWRRLAIRLDDPRLQVIARGIERDLAELTPPDQTHILIKR
jgi:hypothetical protein